METVGVEPTPPSVRARRSSGLSYVPGGVRAGGVEPPQRGAAGLRPVELTGAQRPHGGRGWPTGLEPVPRGSRPRMLAVDTTGTTMDSGDDRVRTGGLSPDKRVLFR